MIHTEQGRLTELIKFMEEDRMYVREALGKGPSGRASRDNSLVRNLTRKHKFLSRERKQTDIINILRALEHG